MVARRIFVILAACALVFVPAPAVAAGTPQLVSFTDFRYGEADIRGAGFTSGGQVAIYVYNPNFNPGPGLAGWARATATTADYKCSATGCRYYPGGEFVVHVWASYRDSNCGEWLRMYAVDEASHTSTPWYEVQLTCPFRF